MTTPDGITARHNPDAHTYELLDDDHVVGTAHYRPFDDSAGPQRIFVHTEVDETREGEGLGSTLAAYALRDTAAAGVAVVPVCRFMKNYLSRHEDLAENAVAVRPEHLQAIEEH